MQDAMLQFAERPSATSRLAARLRVRQQTAAWADRARASWQHRSTSSTLQSGNIVTEVAANGKGPSFQLQGDTSLNTLSAFTARTKLRRNPAITGELTQWWSAVLSGAQLARPGTHILTFADYLLVYELLFSDLLDEEYDEEEARDAALDDWAKDSPDGETLESDAFLDSIFEVADMYTTSLEAEAYIGFLKELRHRITDGDGLFSGARAAAERFLPSQRSREVDNEDANHPRSNRISANRFTTTDQLCRHNAGDDDDNLLHDAIKKDVPLAAISLGAKGSSNLRKHRSSGLGLLDAETSEQRERPSTILNKVYGVGGLPKQMLEQRFSPRRWQSERSRHMRLAAKLERTSHSYDAARTSSDGLSISRHQQTQRKTYKPAARERATVQRSVDCHAASPSIPHECSSPGRADHNRHINRNQVAHDHTDQLAHARATARPAIGRLSLDHRAGHASSHSEFTQSYMPTKRCAHTKRNAPGGWGDSRSLVEAEHDFEPPASRSQPRPWSRARALADLWSGKPAETVPSEPLDDFSIYGMLSTPLQSGHAGREHLLSRERMSRRVATYASQVRSGTAERHLLARWNHVKPGEPTDVLRDSGLYSPGPPHSPSRSRHGKDSQNKTEGLPCRTLSACSASSVPVPLGLTSAHRRGIRSRSGDEALRYGRMVCHQDTTPTGVAFRSKHTRFGSQVDATGTRLQRSATADGGQLIQESVTKSYAPDSESVLDASKRLVRGCTTCTRSSSPTLLLSPLSGRIHMSPCHVGQNMVAGSQFAPSSPPPRCNLFVPGHLDGRR